MSERPKRRQRRKAGEPGVGFHHLLGFRSEEQIIVDRSAFGADGIQVALPAAEVEIRGPSIVEKYAQVSSFTLANKKGNTFVDWIG